MSGQKSLIFGQEMRLVMFEEMLTSYNNGTVEEVRTELVTILGSKVGKSLDPELYKKEFNPILPYSVSRTSMSMNKIRELYDEYKFQSPVWKVKEEKSWTVEQQQNYIDSILHQSYYSSIVLRDICNERLENIGYEVFGGWQQIRSICDFFADKIQLPKSLRDVWEFSCYFREDCSDITIDSWLKYSGHYTELYDSIKEYICNCEVCVDILVKVGDLQNEKHQAIAQKVFLTV